MRFYLKLLKLIKPIGAGMVLCCAALSTNAQTPTIAVDDTVGLCEGTLIFLNVAANDIDLDPGEELKIDVLIGPVSTDITYSEEGDSTILIIVSPLFTGTDVIIYEVCGEDDFCDIGIVNIIVDGSTNCVWPGDANVDSICNYIDLLPIGVFYGNSGPVRYDEDGSWEGSFCDEWDDDPEYVIAPNPKFADCNGDGLINELDTIVIVNNYGQTHGTYIPEVFIGGPADPALGVGFFSDTVEAGSEVIIPLNFGTDSIPASNIYGIAFELEYDNTLIVPSSIKVTFNSSWLGISDIDLISLQSNDTVNGIVSVAVTRKNQISRSGSGNFGEVSFVMEDNIAGKLMSEITETASFCIQFPQTINNLGNPVNINPLCDSVVVYQIIDNVEDIIPYQISIYPNPANDILNIYSPENISGICRLQNLYGQTIETKNINNEIISFELNTIPSGTYIINIKTDDLMVTRKVIIQH
ncbi:MAG: T9SS type A sorting domain-containing protein [Chitinophagales bacterium]